MNKLKALWAKVKMPLWIGWMVFIGITAVWAGITAVVNDSTPLALLAITLFLTELVLPTISKPSIAMNTYNYFNIDETLAKAFKEQAEANCPEKVEPKAEA